MRGPTVDRQLLMVSAGLILFGLLTLYSAGQTDVPTRAAGVWHRQFVWVGIGIVAAGVVYHVSPRLLEWLAPALYGVSIFLLVLVLLVGTGAGTASSSSSWRSTVGPLTATPPIAGACPRVRRRPPNVEPSPPERGRPPNPG